MSELFEALGAALRPTAAPPTLVDAGTLAAAARPFARLLASHHDDLPDATPLFGMGVDNVMTVGDLRRLHAALAPFGGVR
jgi:hypothetical protein